MMSFNREKNEIIYKKIDMQDKVEFNFYIRNFLKYMKKINLFPILLMKKRINMAPAIIMVPSFLIQKFLS